MQKVFTENAPKPAGHYSQAIIHGGIVYVAGQVPINPKTGEKCLGTIEEQTWQVLENISSILEASNSSIENVLKVNMYITDINLWARVNQVYSKFFGDCRPARVVVPIKDLHYGFNIEADAIAFVNEKRK
jgi:2-iminobutanoate/2-iminopropanoate deaminase